MQTRHFKINYFLPIGLLFISIIQNSKCKILKDGFVDRNVRWNWTLDTDEKTITFNGECTSCRGYFTLGFSSNGNMPKSDVAVLFFNKKGDPTFCDAHLVDTIAPVNDTVQNFQPIKLAKKNNNIIFVFKRDLVTCDPQDYELSTDTVKLIYSWSDFTAEILSAMKYHGANKGVYSASLFTDQSQTTLLPDVNEWEIRVNNYTIPERTTTYYCFYVRLPEFARNQQHFYVGNAPIIQEGSENLMHHILVQTCMGDDAKHSKLVGKGFDCTEAQIFADGMSCQPTIALWVIGQKQFLLPSYVGIPVGSKFGYSDYYLLQYHYNNAQHLRNYVDTSGLRIYLTNVQRQYNGGMLNTVSYINYTMAIPPQQPNFIVTSYCPPECTELTFPKEGITIFAAFLHTHSTGRRIRIRHFRGNVELPNIDFDDNYDYNYQQVRVINPEVKVLPGDFLMNECEYNTMNRTKTTLSGAGAPEEMCYTSLYYYPECALSYCMDGMVAEDLEVFYSRRNPYNLPLVDLVPNYPWSAVTDAEMQFYKYNSRYGERQGFCFGNNLDPLRFFRTNFPAVFHPYQKREFCTKC